MACSERASGGRRRQYLGELSSTESIGHGNDSELILTVKIKARHPMEGSLGNEFPSICNHCGVMAT